MYWFSYFSYLRSQQSCHPARDEQTINSGGKHSKNAGYRPTVGAGLLAMNDNAVKLTHRSACIASKPAPTRSVYTLQITGMITGVEGSNCRRASSSSSCNHWLKICN